MKSSVDVVDVLGLYLTIIYFLTGRSETRVFVAGMGWAGAHAISTYLVGFLFGARTRGFHWKYVQSAVDANIDIFFYLSMAGLVWLFTRNDLTTNAKRLVGVLLAFCVYHDVVFQ